MLHIIVATHGPLAPSLVITAQMIIGELPHIHPICLDDDGDTEFFKQEFKHVIEQSCAQADGIVVLCDIEGGVPYNAAYYFAFGGIIKKPIAVVTGVNLPMLLASQELNSFTNPNTYAQKLVNDTIMAITYVQPNFEFKKDGF